MITRRRLLWGSFGATVSAAAYPTLIETRWLELTQTRIRLRSGPKGTVRILQLTDIHASWAVPLSLIGESIEIGLAENPDIVCLTGDYVTFGKEFDRVGYAAALRRLSTRAPVFGVLGNHDGAGWTSRRPAQAVTRSVVWRLLEDAHVELLHNRSRLLEINGCKFHLAGVGDLWSNEMDPEPAFAEVRGDAPAIVIAHNPDSKDYMGRRRWELMLCGHTHGGQVIIPFDGPRYAPVEDKRFVAGLGSWESRQIYVSRGVGNVGGVRFRCRPEVTVIDLEFG